MFPCFAKTPPLTFSNTNCLALMLCTFEAVKRFFMQGAKPPPRCLSPSPWRRPAPDCSSGGRGRPPTRRTFHLTSENPSSVLRGDLISADRQAVEQEVGSSGIRRWRRLRFPPLVEVGRAFQKDFKANERARFYF